MTVEEKRSADNHPVAANDSTAETRSAVAETYNPWTIVNLVFTHLASEGLHPVLGESGDPAEPARALLNCLGIQPAAEGNRDVMRKVYEHLEEIRTVMFESE